MEATSPLLRRLRCLHHKGGIPLRHTRERKENKLNSPTSFSKVIFQNKGWKKSPHVYFNKPYIDLILLSHVHLTGHFVHLALGTPKA
jgi:hypothetical protein